MTRLRRDAAIILLSGLVLESLALGLARDGDLRDGSVAFLSGYLAMSLVYVAAVFYVVKYCQYQPGLLTLGVGIAIVLRITFVFAPPQLSDDIYRYRWDGLVQQHGINPYHLPPQAKELDSLRDPLFHLINNKHLPTIYPPLMELTLKELVRVSSDVIFLKGFFVLVDLVLMAVLRRLLVESGSSPMRLLIYAWSPLVIVEIAGSGHNDVLAICCLLSAQGALLHKKDTLSICLVALSIAAKLAAAALLPFFARAARAVSWSVFPVILVASAWPYRNAGAEGLTGLVAYGLTWRSNDSLFHLLIVALGSRDLAKAVAAGLYVGVVALLVARRVPLLRASFIALGGALLLSPTVHPWYLVWIVPYLCLYPSPAWLLLTSTVVLAYHAPILAPPGTPWRESLSFKLMEYLPFYALGVVEVARAIVRPHR